MGKFHAGDWDGVPSAAPGGDSWGMLHHNDD